MTQTLGDVFQIPEAVHQGDFVLRLTEGLQADRRKQTLQQYVVTPQLVECFDQALGLVGGAVASNSSKGAYLHGSFGSGKSHFMAVMDLILEGDADARAVPELASVVSKHNKWWEGGKFLVVPFHMIGATSMEAAILGGYADYVRQRHPEAPTPGFYRSQHLVENARGLRESMGDDRFFEKLGGDAGAGGWGDIGAGWNAAAFDAAAAVPPDDPEHQHLVGDLVDAFFSHVKSGAGESDYLDLDHGLAVISRHAKALGYTAVVLFLDELILWLASHAGDQHFLNREGQKVAKLVESSDANRPIPLVSFIARQRDLRELVGESVTGADQVGFSDVLQWWEARFDKVVLEDRNLPAIIERRLLRPKDASARQVLHDAFEKTAQARREVLDILLTHEGDKAMFEQVYPFSPALVQTLVALSSLLQRERTALKLMLQLLVDNRDRLTVGDVIPVGDLFDVILSGDEPFTPTIKRQFDRAREIWSRKFVPMLEEEHGVSDETVNAGTAEASIARRYRADAGLLKTLILSALAPDVESLRNLTPIRLAALNHGTIRSPLPNAEASTVVSKMRAWAGHAGEINISADASNPVISMQLAGVDVEGILENARSIDNFGNRVRTVKDLLFKDLSIEAQNIFAPEYSWLWRGTQRKAELLLQNVRELPLDNFRPHVEGWRVIIDFPFDEEGHTPADDRARVQEFRDGGESTRTLVWLPSFLNDRALSDLGRLVTLNHVLSGNRIDEYGAHLQPGERTEARTILRNQRDQLEKRVSIALDQAYGIALGATNAVNTTLSLDEHFESLYTGLRLLPPPGGCFHDSLEHLLDQALSHQFFAHPHFEGEVRKAALKRVWQVIEQAAETSDKRIGMDKSVRDDVRRIVGPLQLGECGEAHFVLWERWHTHLTRKLAEHEVQNPTVSQLRKWLDEPEPMGLPTDISDLVIMTWAAQAGRSFYLHGAAIAPELGRLNRECELRAQPLPAEQDWTTAVQRAADVFGVASSNRRSASNVVALTENVQKLARESLPSVRDYNAALDARLKAYGLDKSVNRARTAAATLQMLESLAQCESDSIVKELAHASIDTSAAAMGAARTKAAQLARSLEASEWNVIATIRKRSTNSTEAAAVVEAVTAALKEDEHVTALDRQLKEQQRKALEILERPSSTPPTTPPPPSAGTSEVKTIRKQRMTLAGATAALQELTDILKSDSVLRVDVEYRVFRPDDET